MNIEHIPNGNFSAGVNYWRMPDSVESQVLPLEAGAPAENALLLDARNRPGWLNVASAPFPISPLRRYAFRADVQRIAGEWGYNIYIDWLDAREQFLAHEYILMGALVGDAWQPYRMECLAPEAARYAMVHIGIPGGWACRVTNVSLISLPIGEPELAIELLPGMIKPGNVGFPLKIRLENRGETVLENLDVTLRLPEGVNDTREDPERYALRVPRLAFAEVATFQIALHGAPQDLHAPLEATVTANAIGDEVSFQATTTAFSSCAEEFPATAEALPDPVLPDMKLRLGCYYFPVMLDWDRNNWGVRPVDYLEPLLGYYDEALPEVADWHIYWAVNHGIEFFVFDWYFNQGMHYLNDALEKGFLQSRFKDKMKFCVDWCNEGHCGQFKPVDFSDKSLHDFITTLCERYFIHDNYLRIDDKPVVIIHVPVKIANAHGGWDGCRAALDRMRETAREYGHPGVFFMCVQNNTPFLLPYQQGGFDGVTPYAYGFRDQIRDPVTDSLSYEALMPLHRECFRIAREEAEAQDLLYWPTAWVGWDDAARSKGRSVHTRGNGPANFRRMLEMLPDYVDSEQRFALFESWNEWGEGGEAEPGIQYRFDRLTAIRDVLSREPGPYEIAAPTPEEVDRFDTPISWDGVERIYLSRHARELGLHEAIRLDFEDPIGLRLRAGNMIRGLTVRDGMLQAESTGPDPSLIGPPWMGLPAERVAAIRIRLRTNHGSEAQLYWLIEEEGASSTWSDDHSIRFALGEHGVFQTYRIPVAEHPAWRGTIRQLRFDPSDTPGAFQIDYFESVAP